LLAFPLCISTALLSPRLCFSSLLALPTGSRQVLYLTLGLVPQTLSLAVETGKPLLDAQVLPVDLFWRLAVEAGKPLCLTLRTCLLIAYPLVCCGTIGLFIGHFVFYRSSTFLVVQPRCSSHFNWRYVLLVPFGCFATKGVLRIPPIERESMGFALRKKPVIRKNVRVLWPRIPAVNFSVSNHLQA
jgi:hypothetical protein